MRFRYIQVTTLFLIFLSAGNVAAQGAAGNEFIRERIELVRSGRAIGDDGKVIFRRDIYDRDPAVLAGLDSRFKFRSRPVIKETAQGSP